ncbi:NAD-dependent epimerase/dehydratase family protein [Rhizobium sp. Leaf262]|uniref:NAD-dependent epimerase/dehydratase family protein n=1 Tax=Rhizobium sp. Leaf262 TaxID=1736312 RepID=UPI00071256D4|nr:NAD-dependent epimerase/dehydratase family protein [Rhizobium sp. Leaf262]KQO76283.1 NAD-dependent epimerase [Rhizobium sp. Leaf262]
MKNKRVLITGGAGLVGSHIADLVALEQPLEIVILDNFVRGRRSNLAQAVAAAPVTIVEGDIRDRALVASCCEGVDIVFHQAAIRITQCAEEPRLAFEVLAEGTFNVLEASVKAGVKKVIAASSASVLGLADEFPTTEDHHPYNNRTIYGATKAFNEGMLRSFAEMYDLNYISLRYFNVYGPRMDIYGAYTEVLIRWMERISAGLPPIIQGDGSQTMDFVHILDVARANLLAAQSTITDRVFNVASGTETSLLRLAQMLLTIMNSSLEPQHVAERKVNAVTRRLADVRRADLELGFRTQLSLESGLRDLVNWWTASQVPHSGEAAA